jgi:hypothetical protein
LSERGVLSVSMTNTSVSQVFLNRYPGYGGCRDFCDVVVPIVKI